MKFNNNYNLKKDNNIQFKSASNAITTGLHFLNTSPSVGAICIDACSMGIPRTTIDSTRGFDAGLETGIREFSSTLNFALFGLWGYFASKLVAPLINKKFTGAQSQEIYANSHSINFFSNLYNTSQPKSGETKAQAFLSNIFKNLSAKQNAQDIKLPEADQKKVIDIITDVISGKNSKQLDKATKETLNTIITSSLGNNQECSINYNGKKFTQNLSTLLDDVSSLGKTFLAVDSNSVSEAFIKQLKYNKGLATVLGLSIPVAIGLSLQPLNALFTKLRTGKDGFVGVEGQTSENKPNFGLKKATAATLFGLGALATIDLNPRKIPNKIQFAGLLPTINQFKFVYGLTIISRLLATRDSNELRESCIKDTLGFVNWLILGGVVSKLTAHFLSKKDDSIINYDDTNVKNKNILVRAWNWVQKSKIKSSEEILLADLKKAGISTLDEQGKAIPLKKLLDLIPENMKNTKIKIRNANIAQVLGYLYSALALGVAIPMLNIYITKKKSKQNTIHNKPVTIVNTHFNQFKLTNNPHFIKFTNLQRQ